jgi:hypothetical protein
MKLRILSTGLHPTRLDSSYSFRFVAIRAHRFQNTSHKSGFLIQDLTSESIQIFNIQTIVSNMSNKPDPTIVNLDSDTEEEDKKASPKEEDPPSASGIKSINPYGAPLKKTANLNFRNTAYIYHVCPDVIDKTSSTPNNLVPAPIRGLFIVMKGSIGGKYQFWHGAWSYGATGRCHK